MNTTLAISAVSGFGTGLSTVGYTVYNMNGVIVTPRTTTGVAQRAPGTYAAEVELSSGNYEIRWDDGGSGIKSDFLEVNPVSSNSSVAGAILGASTEGQETVLQTLRILRAVLAGKASDVNGVATFKRADGTTTAITVAHDTVGNRSASSVGTV